MYLAVLKILGSVGWIVFLSFALRKVIQAIKLRGLHKDQRRQRSQILFHDYNIIPRDKSSASPSTPHIQ